MSITDPAGFRAAGVAAGLKSTGKPDVALVVNDGPQQVAAGVFTSNQVKAAPVLWSEQVLKSQELHAVVLNSGGANACTGPDGFADTHHTAEHVAQALDCGAGEVAVCSTGLIGVRLDLPKLLAGVDHAVGELSADGGGAAAEAIMTTDTVSKSAQAVGDGYVVAGMAKGAGMLAPGLATMLVVLTTDAQVTAETADNALRQAVRTTFDRLDSDGCMSTNDTVLLLASGASTVEPVADEFADLITQVCLDLAMQLLADAEGASKHITVNVNGAATEADAVTVGRGICRSNLFKAAMFGEDPNWGRIISAAGATEVTFDANRIAVSINGVQVCVDGGVGQPREDVDMTSPEVLVEVTLNAGPESATLWTNDLTHAYVHENSAYSS